jgi:sulfatase modifying factor 1
MRFDTWLAVAVGISAWLADACGARTELLDDVAPASAAGARAPILSCVGLKADCGAAANDDCCATPSVPAGRFTFGGPAGLTQASVSAFTLDKYEVTVGRFRNFVGAYAGAPAANSGAHARVSGSGWSSDWNNTLPPDQTALVSAVQCDTKFQTWDASGANDALPMNCIDWYLAFAFCIWDGGYLPTEAEWEYAASGGAEERSYPWGNSPVPDDAQDSTAAYANYDCLGDRSAPTVCAAADFLRVGSKPLGAGRFGQVDLAGSTAEWVLDFRADFGARCDDCANLIGSVSRSVRGGAWNAVATYLHASKRNDNAPGVRYNDTGFRCARPALTP